MDWAKWSLIGMLLVSMPVHAAYNVSLHQQCSIVLDGVLNEWEGVPSTPLNQISSRFKQPTNSQDVSAIFQLLADANNLYIAIKVLDNELTFGKEAFSKTWRQDCVEVYFDGDLVNVQKDDYDSNDGQIRVSSEDGHSAQLEGAVKVGEHILQLPLLWNALGVKAAVMSSTYGYGVEIKIPATVLGRQQLRPNDKVGLNFRVIDVDNDNDLKVLSWQQDYKSTNWLSTRSIAEVDFTGEEIPSSSISTSIERGRLTVTINSDVGSSTEKALARIARGDKSSAEPFLKDILSTVTAPEVHAWASYMLAQQKEEEGNDEEAIFYLEDFLKNTSAEIGLRDWVAANIMVKLAKMYQRVDNEDRACAILVEAFHKIRPGNIGGLYPVGEMLKSMYKHQNKRRDQIEEVLSSYEVDFPLMCKTAINAGGKRAYVGHVLLGEFLETRGDFQKARHEYLECMKFDPEDPDPHIYTGRCFAKEGNYAEAVRNYATALKCTALVKEHIDQAVMGIANSLANLQKADEAIMVLEENFDRLSKPVQVHAQSQIAILQEIIKN
jgi:tetratricopeptide (TPR) repeat protein